MVRPSTSPIRLPHEARLGAACSQAEIAFRSSFVGDGLPPFDRAVTSARRVGLPTQRALSDGRWPRLARSLAAPAG